MKNSPPSAAMTWSVLGVGKAAATLTALTSFLATLFQFPELSMSIHEPSRSYIWQLSALQLGDCFSDTSELLAFSDLAYMPVQWVQLYLHISQGAVRNPSDGMIPRKSVGLLLISFNKYTELIYFVSEHSPVQESMDSYMYPYNSSSQ